MNCHAHADVETIHQCQGCGRPTCDTCAFPAGLGRYCFDCMSAGPTPEQRRSSFWYSVGSIAGAAGGALCFLAIFAAGAKGSVSPAVGAVLALALLLAGGALGLMGRDYSRRTGSPLPTIGVIGNCVLLGLFLILAVIGLARS